MSSPEQVDAGLDRAFSYARCHHLRAQLWELTSARGEEEATPSTPRNMQICVYVPLHLCASKYIPAASANILIATFHVASTKFHVVCQDR